MFHVDETWMQRGLDALESVFQVDDAAKRDMIEYLFDAGFWSRERLTWPAAQARFNDCLNPNKGQFFKVSELWALMKAFGRHQLLHVMAEDLGYQPLRQAPTEERRQALLERIATAEEWMRAEVSRARAELAELDVKPALRVHPAIHEGRGSFSRSEDRDDVLPDGAMPGGF